MDWKSMLVSAAKKIAVLAGIGVIMYLINPLVGIKPWGQYIHAALMLYFVYQVYGRVI